MEHADRDLIEQSAKSNFEVKKLYEQHKEFEERLDKLSTKTFLTAGEETEQRRLKRLKSRGVERMLELARAKEASQAA
jgi:hypothetical protein